MDDRGHDVREPYRNDGAAVSRLVSDGVPTRFADARSFAAVIVLVFAWAIVADAGRPATMAALPRAAGPEMRRAAIALNRLAVNLGMSDGPAVVGFLAVCRFRFC